MTSAISSAKTRPVMNFFRHTLKKQTPLTLLITAFSCLLIPGMLLRDMMSHFEWHSPPYDMDGDMFSVWAALSLGASAVLGFMLLIQNFGFLFSKKAGDVFHALPLTRNQLLLTRSLAALIGGLFNFIICFAAISFINFLPIVNGVPVTLVLNQFLTGILYLFVLASFGLLFIVVSGGYFDVLIAFAAVNLCPVFIAMMLFFVIEENTVGLNVSYDYLIYTTPIAFIFYKYGYMGYVQEYSETASPIEKTNLWSILTLTVFAALCIAATVKLFKVRKSETAGEAYSFKFVPAIIIVLVSMVGGFFIAEILSGFSLNLDVLFWMFFVVGALLCSVAAGAVISRGFKNLKASFIKGAAAIVLMVILVIVSTFAGTAAQNRIPKAEQIEKIQLFHDESVEFTDNFHIVLDLHKGIVENIKAGKIGGENSEFANNMNDVRITYRLKNSGVLRRNYWMSSPNMDNLYPQLLAVMQSDEYLKRYENCVSTDGLSVNVQLLGDKYGYNELVYDDSIADLTEKQAKEFIDLFKKELRAADVSVFNEHCYAVYVNGTDYKELFIPHSFTQTMDYIGPLLIPEDEYYASLGR